MTLRLEKWLLKIQLCFTGINYILKYIQMLVLNVAHEMSGTKTGFTDRTAKQQSKNLSYIDHSYVKKAAVWRVDLRHVLQQVQLLRPSSVTVVRDIISLSVCIDQLHGEILIMQLKSLLLNHSHEMRSSLAACTLQLN